MKKSEIFWITITVIAVICYNIFWYNYELKYANDPCQLCQESNHTIAVSLGGVAIDVYFLLFCIIFLIPKFNKWIDSL